MSFKLGDATALPLNDNSVHLIFTSPPYNVGIEYADDATKDQMDFTEYLKFSRAWMAEAKRVLVPGGRLCINIANTHRSPYIPLNFYIVGIAIDLGFLIRQEFVWDKGDAVARGRTSWGSWKNASNPCFRDSHEYVEVFSKDSWSLDTSQFPPSDLTSKENSDYTIGLRTIPPSGHGKGHPVPFPEDLARQFIKLYTHPGMTVLDPFSGSGTTVRVAKLLKREGIGIDKSPTYIKLAESLLGGLFK